MKSELMKRGLINPISPEKQKERGWTFEVNGKKVPDVASIQLSNPNFGEWAYGLTRGGWDGWAFHEVGGGGSVVIPFVVVKGELYIGLLRQERPNQGGEVWNVPRGFLKPGEGHFAAAKREFKEEAGLADIKKRLLLLEGEPANPNSAFFVTSKPTEGVKFYAFEVLEEEVEPITLIPLSTEAIYRLKKGMVKPVSKQAEEILSCRFHRWQRVARLGDMFTLAALARLVASQAYTYFSNSNR